RHPVLASSQVERSERARRRAVSRASRESHLVALAEFNARDVRKQLKISTAYTAWPRLKSNRVLDAGREAEASELFGDVARGFQRAGRARAAAFELVGGEVVDVLAQALNVRDDVLRDLLPRERGRRDERDGEEQAKTFSVQHGSQSL